MEAGLCMRWVVVLVLALTQVAFAPGAPEAAKTFLVNNILDLTDGNPGDGVCETAAGSGVCTLRAAIMEANANPGHDTILLGSGTFLLTRSGYDDTGVNGDLDILESLILIGVDDDHTIIDGSGGVLEGRIFHVHTGSIVTMRALRLTDGNAKMGTAEDKGAAVFNDGSLTLEQVVIAGNVAAFSAGVYNNTNKRLTLRSSIIGSNNCMFSGCGLANYGVLRLEQSIINGNKTTGGDGGGLYSVAPGTAYIAESQFFNNEAVGAGGIYAAGEIDIFRSTIFNNKASAGGGGLYLSSAQGDLLLTNSTIYGNSAGAWGGGLLINGGIASLSNVTIARNVAGLASSNTGLGAGMFVEAGLQPKLRNTLIALNTRDDNGTKVADDCKGTLLSHGYNMLGSTNNCVINGANTGNITGVDPLLAPALAFNGGLTRTLALLDGSQAIDAGNEGACTNVVGGQLLTDQRGYARMVDGDNAGGARCDIGAFEFNAPLPWAVYLPVTLK